MEDNFEGVDPKAFFEQQKRLYGEEHRERQDYERFCRAAARILRSRDGQDMLAGIKNVIQFGSSAFRAEDEYNSHAAAARDGAAATVTEIEVAARLGEKLSKRTDDPS